MTDIGSILRETRIRDKIDITAVEQGTKIRAKYLRALENEEWNVLPGPAYAKSFLRTYAEFLGLDAHMLVEEYRARYEQPEELEVPAFTRSQPLRGRVRPPGPPSRLVTAIGVLLAFVALLFVLGITGGGDDDQASNGKPSEPASSAARARAEARREKRRRERAAASQPFSLSVTAARNVWVCLVNAKGRALIGGRTLAAGEKEGPFRSTRFRVTLGNGGGELRVNGKLRPVDDKPVPVGYAVGAKESRPLPESRRPTCGPGESQPPPAAGPSGASGL
jgi:cytoskeleton protein RodZ